MTRQIEYRIPHLRPYGDPHPKVRDLHLVHPTEMLDVEVLLSEVDDDLDDLERSFRPPAGARTSWPSSRHDPPRRTSREPRPVGTVGNPAGSAAKLQPIFNPAHNLREAAKQLWLLEDHLSHPDRQCPDCIRKHLLAAEALAEEAATLDRTGTHSRQAHDLAQAVRAVSQQVVAGMDKSTLAQEVRRIRKGLSRDHFAAVAQDDQGNPIGPPPVQPSVQPSRRPVDDEGDDDEVGSDDEDDDDEDDDDEDDDESVEATAAEQKAAAMYGRVREAYVQAIRRAKESGEEDKARALHQRGKSALRRIRRDVVVRSSLGAVADEDVLWSVDKARNKAVQLFARAAQEAPGQRSAFEALASKVKQGELYADVTQPHLILKDVVWKTREYAPQTAREARALYEDAQEAAAEGRIEAPPRATAAPSVQWSEGMPVIFAYRPGGGRTAIQSWHRGTVLGRGEVCGDVEVESLPQDGYLAVFASVVTSQGEQAGCVWVAVDDVVPETSPPISKMLRGKTLALYEGSNIESLPMNEQRLAMADLIESVLLSGLGDLRTRIRVPGFSDLSDTRIATVANKIVLAAIVNAVYESRLDPDAIGRAKETGLFQIHPMSVPTRFKGMDLTNPKVNTGAITTELSDRLDRGRLLELCQREAAAPTELTAPSAMEWTAAFTTDVERPFKAEEKARKRGRTTADLLGLSAMWPLEAESAPPVAVTAPAVVVPPGVSPPAPLPPRPTFVQPSTWEQYKKPVAIAAGVGLTAVALKLAWDAWQAQQVTGGAWR